MRKVILLILSFFLLESVSAQKIGVKSNVLYDAMTTMNVGVEFGIAPQWTLDISGGLEPLDITPKTAEMKASGCTTGIPLVVMSAVLRSFCGCAPVGWSIQYRRDASLGLSFRQDVRINRGQCHSRPSL